MITDLEIVFVLDSIGSLKNLRKLDLNLWFINFLAVFKQNNKQTPP